MRVSRVAACLAIAAALSTVARAQMPVAVEKPAPVLDEVATPDAAFAADAADYARHYAIAPDEALRRLRAQQESVAFTDSLAAIYAARLAGIAFEHKPELALTVLLTGADPVPDARIYAGGMNVPVRFRTGALATRAQAATALADRAADLRTRFPMTRGIGVDMRSGEIVAMLLPNDAEQASPTLAADLAGLLGVPVRLRVIASDDENMMLAGGSRVTGLEGDRRFACTAGFVVTDGPRTGIATAAHCPDALSYAQPGGERVPLAYAGAWGARHQDVQIGVSPAPLGALFYADGARVARPLTGARSRLGVRAGEYVCHRGEGSGYSCAEIDLVDYAPPGDLCGGPCDATWVTVRGPICKSGDSGGPVFSGTIAYGIVKGRIRRGDNGCAGYFFMSTDFLPEGWRLALAGERRDASPDVGPVSTRDPASLSSQHKGDAR